MQRTCKDLQVLLPFCFWPLFTRIDMRDFLAHTAIFLEQYFHTHERDKYPQPLSLMNGHTGLALFFAYYHLYTRDESYLALAQEILEHSFELAAEDDTVYTFGGGVAGLGWTFQHFVSLGFLEADEEILQECDDFVAKMGIRSFSLGNYDPIYGGVGCGLYFLERNQPKILEIMIQELESSAIVDEIGMYWYDMLSKKKGQEQVINFGVAHGLPSILYFLAKTYQKGICVDKCLQMIDAITDLLFRYESDQDTFAFPSRLMVKDGNLQVEKLNRLGWCYGDLGISAILIQVGKITKKKHLYDAGLRLALRTCRLRTTEETLIHDAGLCHGSFGAAHIYRRLHEYTDRSEFQGATIYWEGISNRFFNHLDSPAAFKEWHVGKWEPSYGFLTGLTGASLAMISSLSSDIKPGWDRALLLS